MSDRNGNAENRSATRWGRVPLWLTAIPAVVLVAAVAVAVNGVGGRTPRPTRVEALDVIRSTTTAATARPTSSTTPSTAAPTTTVVATTVAPTPTTARRAVSTVPVSTTSPTTAPKSCLESNDPACGPMYFSPTPGPDKPLRIVVTQSPANPVVGQQVTFHVVMDDPDGPIGCVAKESDGVSGMTNECGFYPACDRYGAWPPPPPSPGHAERDFTETYRQPGHYAFYIDVTPYNTPCVDSRTGRGANPYVSSGSATLPFTVS